MKKSASILFFSGSGGTRIVASEFERKLKDKGFDVRSFELDYSKKDFSYDEIDKGISESGYFFMLFPVHAFDAPDIVYSWIDRVKASCGSTIVVSVSAGGEGWPNIGTRINCIRALEKKGFKVVYERMMIMPSNWVFELDDKMAMRIINIVPEKVKGIIDDVLAGTGKRDKRKNKPLFQTVITKLEKWGAKKFGKTFKIADACTGCGLCANTCPMKNIDMDNNRPVYSNRCIVCFRCIYSCPEKAILSKNFMVLKKGYNLDKLMKRMKDVELEPLDEKLGKNILWKVVYNYLTDKKA